MKRKLTKQNKQFMSSRLRKYGNYTFQPLTEFTFDEHLNVVKARVFWEWSYSN